MKLSHDMMLALAYVSQISDPDRVRTRFFESVNARDEGPVFTFSARYPEGIPEDRTFPIATFHSPFGYAVVSEGPLPNDHERAVFRNAFQFLAVLLENRIQARTVKARNDAFRKQAEESLAYNDTLLRIAAETATFGGWSVDLRDRVCIWSDIVADIHGVPRGYSPPVDEGIDFYAPEWRETISRAFTDCAEKGIPYDEEMQIITAQGRRVWVRTTAKALRDKQGNIVKVQGAFQDISDRKHVEIELRNSETRFRLLAESAPVGIVISDDEQRTIYVSKRFVDIFGYTMDDIPSVDAWWPLAYPDEKQRETIKNQWNTTLEQSKKTDSDIAPFEFPVTCKDGTVRHIEFRLAYAGDLNFVIFIDVTERRMMDQELRRLKDHLEQEVALKTRELNDRVTELKKERHKLKLSNEELEAFAYSVSHDLRAPLRAIDGFSRFLMEDYADKLDDEGKRMIETIRQNTAGMDRLISDLLGLSRVSRVDMNPVPIKDMDAVARSMFHESATDEQKKTFELIVDPLPTVSCDLSLIKQVWQNLIGNALKYSARSSVKRIHIHGWEEGPQAVFCIRDQGAGFDERYAHKLFALFQRLHKDDEFEGSGAGLAIVQRIIARHGGRVWAEGTIDHGAAFYFSLPQTS
jgi:PAS domain S-box-containing protein